MFFLALKNKITFKDPISRRHTEHHAALIPALISWLTLAQACKPSLGC